MASTSPWLRWLAAGTVSAAVSMYCLTLVGQLTECSTVEEAWAVLRFPVWITLAVCVLGDEIRRRFFKAGYVGEGSLELIVSSAPTPAASAPEPAVAQTGCCQSQKQDQADEGSQQGCCQDSAKAGSCGSSSEGCGSSPEAGTCGGGGCGSGACGSSNTSSSTSTRMLKVLYGSTTGIAKVF